MGIVFNTLIQQESLSNSIHKAVLKMPHTEQYFHLHLISDSTGETLIAASRAVASQYHKTNAIEHVYPLIKNQAKLDEVFEALNEKPGIVLFTIANENLATCIQEKCSQMGIPCVSVLEPIFQVFQSYLGAPTARKSGAQHELNAEYFNRIDAINFTLMHDDGALPDDLEEADIVLLGISRTSKTPTSLYLANRGLKTTNFPLFPDIEIPDKIQNAKKPLVIALLASIDRIYQVRQNRILGLEESMRSNLYTDRAAISEELSQTRKLCKRFGWPMIDVSRKSIEETAAAIYLLWQEHRQELKI